MENEEREKQNKSIRKSAKKLIKVAKKHPTWYTTEEVRYAKIIRKSLKKNATSETGVRDSRSGEDNRIHSESKQPKEPEQSKRSRIAQVLYQAWALVRF
tara:strand:- start:127 stop:423 length:297 start_codon:yes stop_codon:yes gene_type:complete